MEFVEKWTKFEIGMVLISVLFLGIEIGGRL